MATHRELQIDWEMLDSDCNNWTLQDLELAAELGRTLLERNEELDTELRQQQGVIDDQVQEIEFLTKQLSSMKEESSNRSKIYEQLENSISELERTNSQLSRKHEVDKKRIQSLCENIEYLERKCEELSASLQSIRDQGKKSGANMSRSTFSSFGSDSSEEEMTGFGLFRKRSHSLQDLRDYTPSPDEFDSGNSNSPDLKTSEAEFIDSLENRIEELLASRNKESEKVRQLENQIKALVQEYANLQHQLHQINCDKDGEVTELRRLLQDISNDGFHTQMSFVRTSTPRNSEEMPTLGDSSLLNTTTAESCISTSFGLNSSTGVASFSRNSSSICRRCASEIQILSHLNSIENDGNLYDWEYAEEEIMEFSSLEHELAKATGTPRRRDSKRCNDEFNIALGHNSPNKMSRRANDGCINMEDLEKPNLSKELDDQLDPYCPATNRNQEFINNLRSRKSGQKRLSESEEEKTNKENGKRNPKLLKLPIRIPAEDEEEVDLVDLPLEKSPAVGVCEEKNCDKPLTPKAKESPASFVFCQNSSTFDDDEYDIISECSEASETGSFPISGEIAETTSPSPEYKQILHSLFNIFSNSKRKYPIPMYHFIHEARRQTYQFDLSE